MFAFRYDGDAHDEMQIWADHIKFQNPSTGGGLGALGFDTVVGTYLQGRAGKLFTISGVPSDLIGSDGDWVPSDNGHLYFKTGGAWVQKV